MIPYSKIRIWSLSCYGTCKCTKCAFLLVISPRNELEKTAALLSTKLQKCPFSEFQIFHKVQKGLCGSHFCIAFYYLHLLRQKILRKCIWFVPVIAHRIDRRLYPCKQYCTYFFLRKSTPASPIVL